MDDVSAPLREGDEVARLLVDCGLPRPQAKVVVALLAGELPSPALERAADLRQSDLSVALTRLKARGFVAWRADPTGTVGRPTHVVRLAAPLADVADALAREGAPPAALARLRAHAERLGTRGPGP